MCECEDLCSGQGGLYVGGEALGVRALYWHKNLHKWGVKALGMKAFVVSASFVRERTYVGMRAYKLSTKACKLGAEALRVRALCGCEGLFVEPTK